MTAGAPVVVKDSTGKIIAQGSLGQGTHPIGQQYATVICTFPITVKDVPDSDFYSISVGHRGDVPHTRAELEASGWNVVLTLG